MGSRAEIRADLGGGPKVEHAALGQDLDLGEEVPDGGTGLVDGADHNALLPAHPAPRLRALALTQLPSGPLPSEMKHPALFPSSAVPHSEFKVICRTLSSD